MSALFRVSVGHVNVACFADDRNEAIFRTIDLLRDMYGEEDIDPELCRVVAISATDVDFNDEVII